MNKAKLICSYARGKNILDIGCSGYDNVHSLHHQMEKILGKWITGIDSVNGEVVDFVCDVNNDMSWLGDNFFDTIILSETIEHIGNPFKLIRECHRVLRKNGRIIITTPNACSIFQVLTSDKSQDMFLFNKQQLEKALKKGGFVIVKSKYYNNFFSKNPFLMLSCWLIPSFIPKLRQTLFIAGEK